MKKKFYLHQAQWDWFEKCGVDMSNCILTQPIPQMPKEKSMAIINKNCTYVLYQLDWDAFNVLAPFQDEEKLFEYQAKLQDQFNKSNELQSSILNNLTDLM